MKSERERWREIKRERERGGLKVQRQSHKKSEGNKSSHEHQIELSDKREGYASLKATLSIYPPGVYY
jgi:hypothetical protein